MKVFYDDEAEGLSAFQWVFLVFFMGPAFIYWICATLAYLFS
jgi:hypothetical protein